MANGGSALLLHGKEGFRRGGNGVVAAAAQGEQLQPDQPQQVQRVILAGTGFAAMEQQRLQQTGRQRKRYAGDFAEDLPRGAVPADSKKAASSSSHRERIRRMSAGASMLSSASSDRPVSADSA